MREDVERKLKQQRIKQKENKHTTASMTMIDRGEEVDIDRLKVSDIVLDYNNDQIIKLLKKRGMEIAKHNYDKAREVDQEID
jgi:maleate cis-trans isomerase